MSPVIVIPFSYTPYHLACMPCLVRRCAGSGWKRDAQSGYIGAMSCESRSVTGLL